MPPANSPSDTRPSTPPPHTYLRQLEEAIATPVPDLASTLNLTSTDPRSQNQQWANRPPAEDNEGDGFGFSLTPEELREWNAESQLRATMQTQRAEAAARERFNGRNWTSPPARAGDDSDGDIEAMGVGAARTTDTNARRDFLRLERVLQGYRSARSAMRSTRSSDLGAVPTASALRAFWNEEADDDSTTSIPGVSGYSSNRYRREHPPRHAQNVREPTEPLFAASISSQRSDAFKRVRKLIRYLSQLRHTGVEGGLEAARELGLDSLYASDDSYAPSDLPMHINSLPVPQYSSWLQAGMVWHGLQSTEREPPRGSATTLRRHRQRELIRRTIARRRVISQSVIPGEEAAEPPTDSLLDAERYLSDLLQDSNGRWGFSQRSPTSLLSHPTQTSSQSTEPDHWPVKVTIHSVDWDAMTVTGIMSASQMPEKLFSMQQSASPQQGATASMSSFFTGEIIDFRQQPLETEKEGRDYEVGGLDVDARYWERLGPFRKEIERIRHLRGKKRSEYQQSSSLWEALRKAAGADGENKDSQGTSNAPTPSTDDNITIDESPMKVFETLEDKEAEGDEIMARSLGSAKWIEEKLGKEWILMRWKERCFVTLPGSPTNTSSTRTIFTERRSGGNGHGSTSWGLTIAGFYYIALNRLTGEIDGLYYDPGSQPYQTIKMLPEGTTMSQPQPCGCGEHDCREPVGVKKWFPSVEFR
ncbi:uncharacterized protein Z519_03469 [Cladophialophora bantiana CBS 173.52]|uniref:Post-SET domain-containing protein n=1 Tax=Cladophialophora bantiana (strain ATCC 10958 / CBS 173.52 / CDC B-1940 / NIH 8579) TaxID=1442370 RepID=A0A0D2HZQ2_CLAB1|nr:uncharacterized protein Z519_03469 [Cladophialophora bantiana CBS 173.52]KIW96400.1 hypothetical protein Z519_03469 [Cladophialophora bantiana CBS 173.52]